LAAPREGNTEIVSFDNEAGKPPTAKVMKEARRLADALRLDARPATARRHGPGSPLVHRDSLIALATLERDRTNMVEAERLAAAAAMLNPTDQEAAALLPQLRALRQRPAGSR
jgi:hypothetical protein